MVFVIIGTLVGIVFVLLVLIFVQTKEMECYMRICEKQEIKIFELREKLKEMDGES